MKAVFLSPGAAPNAKLEGIILEGDLDTGHRNVGEDDEINCNRQEKQIVDPALLHQLLRNFPRTFFVNRSFDSDFIDGFGQGSSHPFYWFSLIIIA